MQFFCNTNRSQSMLTTIQLGVSTVFSTAHERDIASIACLHDFTGPALLSCSTILTYQLLGSQVWTALPLEKSRSPATVNKLSKPRHNSRTKLCIVLSLIHNRDNVELYLHCKFQSSPFSVHRKNGVTDGRTDRQTDRQNDRQSDYSMPRGSAHRGIKMHHWCGLCLGGCACNAITEKDSYSAASIQIAQAEAMQQFYSYAIRSQTVLSNY